MTYIRITISFYFLMDTLCWQVLWVKEKYLLNSLYPHKKVSRDLTKFKQDFFILVRFYHNQLRKSRSNMVNICQA